MLIISREDASTTKFVKAAKKLGEPVDLLTTHELSHSDLTGLIGTNENAEAIPCGQGKRREDRIWNVPTSQMTWQGEDFQRSANFSWRCRLLPFVADAPSSASLHSYTKG